MTQTWHATVPAGRIVPGEVVESRHVPLWVAEMGDALLEDINRRMRWRIRYSHPVADPKQFRFLGGVS
ncbi:hypothetical protein [Acrocarpospora sp. B8E8]|uniref:hypothetical protein n=1 Tax=Acrocarpospora sp. B8E8 TaxID=3153572 RepID=UPI00325F5ED5